jgi:hypothetical protein
MPVTQSGGGWFGSTDDTMSGMATTTNYNSSTGVSSGIIQYIFYFFVLVCILLLFLLVIHYTITPIFILSPGGKGIVSIPGTDDSKLFWQVSTNTKTPTTLVPIMDIDSGIGQLTQGYSFMVDIQVDNPTANTGAPRILLSRGDVPTDPSKLSPPWNSTKDTILRFNPNFNICLSLDSLINDLLIQIQTTNPKTPSIPNIESITIPNIPVGKAVRIGIMMSSNLIEVYINGYLIDSKVLMNPLREQYGSFQPPLDIISSNTARVSNLRIWRRMLGVSEFRSYGTAISLSLKALPDSCSA